LCMLEIIENFKLFKKIDRKPFILSKKFEKFSKI
jgi:hypothetical protein